MKQAARSTMLIGAGACAVLIGCVLPGFEKVDASPPSGKVPPEACGLSDQLPSECDTCIRQKCCDLAQECDEGTACGEDLLEPITPLADFSKDFDDLLACVQRFCNAACQVSWGCVDNYEWPGAGERVEVPITVVDFASEQDMPIPVEGVTVKACDARDPGCNTGKRAEGKTGADGSVALDMPPSFSGFYTFEGGKDPTGLPYRPSTVQWNAPIHRLGSGFLQYALSDLAIAGLAMITHVTDDIAEFDPARGHLIVRIQGCLPLRYLPTAEAPFGEAEHVKFSFDPDDGEATRLFYTASSGGVTTNLEETTVDGVGGAFNVQATVIQVKAVDTVTGREVANGEVQVNAGGIGFMYLVPRSR